jgi:ubiquinone/menaquinone biosynthesis C-methylase UbiE
LGCQWMGLPGTERLRFVSARWCGDRLPMRSCRTTTDHRRNEKRLHLTTGAMPIVEVSRDHRRIAGRYVCDQNMNNSRIPQCPPRLAVVLVRDANGNQEKVDAVSEFLVNEHFRVMRIDNHRRQVTSQLSSGGSPVSGSVAVTSIDTADSRDHHRREIYSVLGIGEGPNDVTSPTTLVRWIDFLGNPDEEADLDSLLTSVTHALFQLNEIRHVRREIRQHTRHLLQSTINCYENNHFLENYSAKWERRLPVEQLKQFLGCLPEGACILDAGCGPGHHAEFMASRGHHVVATDITEASMRLTSPRSSECLSAVRADINRLPFGTTTFDGVWCCATLVHFPIEVLVQPLLEFRRILSPSGILSFSASIGKLPAADPDGRFFDSFVDESQIESVCIAANLEILTTDLTVSKRTTSGGRQLARWITVLARVR